MKKEWGVVMPAPDRQKHPGQEELNNPYNELEAMTGGSSLHLVFYMLWETGQPVTVADLGPGSRWEEGEPWMINAVIDLVQEGILTPVAKLRDTDQRTCHQ